MRCESAAKFSSFRLKVQFEDTALANIPHYAQSTLGCGQQGNAKPRLLLNVKLVVVLVEDRDPNLLPFLDIEHACSRQR